MLRFIKMLFIKSNNKEVKYIYDIETQSYIEVVIEK